MKALLEILANFFLQFLGFKVIMDKVPSAGYFFLLEKKKKKFVYSELIPPYQMYAPWLKDKDFLKTYDAIKNYTLVDKYRCYDLWSIVGQVSKLEKGAMIEVGSWRGGSAGIIAKSAETNGLNDTLYVCDTFEGIVKASENDGIYKGGELSDTSAETANEILTKLNLSHYKILVGIFPEDTVDQVSETTFRFCHIDVDVYQSAKDTFEWVWPLMVSGGIVVFDDYISPGCDGIAKFVEEEKAKSDRIFIHSLNGHAIMIKK